MKKRERRREGTKTLVEEIEVKAERRKYEKKIIVCLSMMICTMVVESSIEEKRFTRLFVSNISFALNILDLSKMKLLKTKH